MGTGAVGSQVSIVDGWMQRHGSRGAYVLVRVLKNELLQLGRQPLSFVQDALVVNWTGCSLDRNMRAEVEVELEGVGASRLNKSSWKRVVVPIALASIREEADMVTLAGDDDRELGQLLATKLLETFLHVFDLFFKNSGVLALGNSIANVEDSRGRLALADALHPVLCHEAKVVVNGGSSDHLNAVAVGLNLSPVFDKVWVGRDSDGCKRGSFRRRRTRSRMRHIGTDNHGCGYMGTLVNALDHVSIENLLEALFGAILGISCDLATEVAPPSLALTFMQTLEIYCGDAAMTCFAWST